MVESSAAVIWKPPSPAMTQTSFSGQAILAPMAAGSAKPMVPRPPEVMSERGASCLKYCASHIWCWPTSVTMMVCVEAACGLGLAPDVVDDVGGVEVAVVGQVDDVAYGGVALHGVDLAEPVGRVLLLALLSLRCSSCRKQRQQRVEDFFEVADEGDVGPDVLVDLGGVDLDVDLLRVGRVVGEVAGDAVVEAHAEGEQEVGLLDGVVDPGLAVHAHHAERERMRGGEGCRGRAAWWRRGSGGVRRRRGPRARRRSAMMPWPARMTGFFAALMSSMASRIAADSARSMGCGR